MAALQIIEAGARNPRSIGLNIVGKTSADKTGPIPIPPTVAAGVFPRAKWVNIGMPGCGEGNGGDPSAMPSFNASQHLFEARVDASTGRLSASSVMQANENTMITKLQCHHCATTGQPIKLSLFSSDVWKLPKSSGANSRQLWVKHENNYADANPMALGTCDPTAVLVRGVSRFQVSDGILKVYNGSNDECPLLLGEGQTTGPWATDNAARVVVRGPCSDLAGQWTLQPSTQLSQHYIVKSVHTPTLCLGPSKTKDELAYAVDCKEPGTFVADVDPTSGHSFSLQLANDSRCLISTAGNTNNTLAIVSEVRADRKPLNLTTVECDGRIGASGFFTMRPGHSYEIISTLVTRRDLAEPGQYRYARGGLADPTGAADVVAAASRAAANADAASLLVEHAEWWAKFWNKSSVDLGPKRQTIEGWWYGMQYLLGSASRAGEVVPSLFGPWVVKDPPSWVDDITM